MTWYRLLQAFFERKLSIQKKLFCYLIEGGRARKKFDLKNKRGGEEKRIDERGIEEYRTCSNCMLSETPPLILVIILIVLIVLGTRTVISRMIKF